MMDQPTQRATINVTLGGRAGRQATLMVPSDLTAEEALLLQEAIIHTFKQLQGAPGPKIVVPSLVVPGRG